ncbi:flagellar biosynthesis protein FlhF [Variovorax sp. OV329]|uniref:flagellar biosynthesis protein FlhF n=1 Tax=Variovorax sp. OV329 TaxID=1882825 RepID=UPI0008E6B71F|nr:flagellar biosynthesis protein FlhF [Variovorax sp. OV329]SFM65072.1 flagellar biosynthesis protein FlhF [Variovorax sp. OV329]
MTTTKAFNAGAAARKFFAISSREALRLAREALGAEAMVLSSRVLPHGVEVVAMAAEQVDEAVARAPGAAPIPAPAPLPSPAPMPTVAPVSAPAVAPAYASGTAVALSQAMARAVVPAPTFAPVATAVPAPRESAVAAPVAPAEPAVAAAHAAPAGAEATDSVLSELHSMRGMLEEQMASMAWNEQQRRDPVRGRLLRTLLGAGFSAGLSRAMLERLPTGQSYAKGMDYVRSELTRVMSVREDEEALLAEGGVYALMGPTGVGKTTTTAKLAARCVMRFGADKIALVTTDSYRIGAYEQLRIYGQILDVPVYAVKDAADLHLVLKDLREKHVVLIDTVGMSQRDRAVSNQIAMLCSGDRPVKRLLLLNATSHGDTLNEVVHAYRNGAGGGELAGCIFTKVDEATHTGALIDTVIRHRLTVHYVSSGQKVPENLLLADRTALVDGVFQPRRHAALFTAAGDTEAQDKSAEVEIAKAQAETDRLRLQYQQLIRAMAHDAEAVADAATALGGAGVGFGPAHQLWRQAGNADADQRAVLETLMSMAREEVAAGCGRYVLAMSGQLGLQSSESGDRYLCQASLLLSDRDGRPLAAPRQWLSTASVRKPGLRPLQWLRDQDFGEKTMVQLLPRLPAGDQMEALQDVRWVSRALGSTSVVDLRTGYSAVLSRLPLDFGPALRVLHKGKPALQALAQVEVRLRSSAEDEPALRCVVTRFTDPRSGKLLAQGYGLSNLGHEVNVDQLAQWLGWGAEAESCLRLVRQGLALCGGMGEPGDPHMFKRLLIAAQVATTVWRVQVSTQAWADRTRTLLAQLTGKSVRPGRPVPASVLYTGMDKLFSLLDALGTEAFQQAPAAAVAAAPAVQRDAGASASA